MEDDAVTSALLARHRLKHPIDHTDMEVHMLVQAGAEPVDKGYGANVQRCLVHMRSTMFSTALSRCIK